MVALGRGLVAQRTVRALVVVEPEVPGMLRVQRVAIGLFAQLNVLFAGRAAGYFVSFNR